tara:strand:+ start:293 stop:727 length:435 start_codon:yes stop_codon:yes gene_type:complete
MSLTVTISEDLILNGNDRSNTSVATFAVNELDHRIVKIKNVETTILLFGSENAAGTIENTHLKYLRITNLDSDNIVNLRIRNASREFMIQLDAQGSFLLTEDKLDADASGTEEVIALEQITQISAIGSESGGESLEIYAASAFS